jgi:hypothetical protein
VSFDVSTVQQPSLSHRINHGKATDNNTPHPIPLRSIVIKKKEYIYVLFVCFHIFIGASVVRVHFLLNNLIERKQKISIDLSSALFQMIVRRCLSNRLRFSLNQLRFQSIRRVNPLGIQMLSSKLHKQLFASVGEPTYSDQNVKKSRAHLQKFELGSNESEKLDDVEFDLPPLESSNLNEHFKIIAQQQSTPYVELINQMIQAQIPTQPTIWNYEKGWTKFV